MLWIHKDAIYIYIKTNNITGKYKTPVLWIVATCSFILNSFILGISSRRCRDAEYQLAIIYPYCWKNWAVTVFSSDVLVKREGMNWWDVGCFQKSEARKPVSSWNCFILQWKIFVYCDNLWIPRQKWKLYENRILALRAVIDIVERTQIWAGLFKLYTNNFIQSIIIISIFNPINPQANIICICNPKNWATYNILLFIDIKIIYLVFELLCNQKNHWLSVTEVRPGNDLIQWAPWSASFIGPLDGAAGKDPLRPGLLVVVAVWRQLGPEAPA